MTETRFGEKVLGRELVPNSDSFPTEISAITREVAEEAGLEVVLRIMESPKGAEAVAFMDNLWSGIKA